jgi:ABC-type cobalamin/Fe3+-siderophores transport system ATPase subunit
MNVNYPPWAIIKNQIPDLIERITFARELGLEASVKPDLLELYDKVEGQLNRLKSTIELNNFTNEYTNQLAKDLDQLTVAFPSSYGSGERKPIKLQYEEKNTFKNQQERLQAKIEEALTKFSSSFDFFSKLDFLHRDLVIVGANGSGKTTLAKHLTTHIKGNGVLVSAQRILKLPIYESIRSYATTADHVKAIQLPNEKLDIRHKADDEFGILIEHLLADDSRALKQNRNQKDDPFPPPTKLQVLLMMWNGLFSHLQLTLPDDINIGTVKESLTFHVSKMSDGEKVALFLIAHALLCPQNGFIIVDEPEMFLHPTIHKELWDRLEAERNDATFIYFTHDLNFASSRNAKKLWLKSFTYPDQFLLEEIPENEIPPALLMELLGSQRNILFCEGEVGSLDEKVYNILFPNHVIKPVGGCGAVINYTKAFNKIPEATRKALGIIDGDYISTQRSESLKRESIFVIKVPDVENLLLDEAVLVELSKECANDIKPVEKTKSDILKKLTEERSKQIAKYVSAKVDHYFKDSNMSSGKDLDAVKANYSNFIKNIDIERWSKERGEQIDKVILEKDYFGAIQLFKDKNLFSIVRVNFSIRDYPQRAIELLQKVARLKPELRKHFPSILAVE